MRDLRNPRLDELESTAMGCHGQKVVGEMNQKEFGTVVLGLMVLAFLVSLVMAVMTLWA